MKRQTAVIERNLRKLLDQNKQLIQSLKREVHYYKGGKLYIKHNRNKVYYYEYQKGNERAITSDKDRIKLLARYELIKNCLSVLEFTTDELDRIIKKITNVRNRNEQDLFDLLSVSVGLYTEQQLDWITKPYQRNPYHPEHLQYITNNGVKVRSKSEQAIANRLEAAGIAYRAEPPIQLGGKTIYPDFVILLANGDVVIWEHFGLMTDEAYRQNAQGKIELYRNYGFVQHKNLICTYEEDIKSAGDIDQIIERFLF